LPNVELLVGPEVQRARELVLEHGWNTTCYQLLNPGMTLWFSQSHPGVVGYVKRAGVRVVAGAPVCAPEHLAAVEAEWNEDCDRSKDGVCYFGAEARMCAYTEGRPGYSSAVLGAQPTWAPDKFLEAIQGNRDLRYQLSRASNKHVEIREWPSSAAAGNPDLRRCLQEWLATRGLPPLHFLVEPHTLDNLWDRRLFVAEKEGEPVGFVVLSPVPSRQGWLTEQFVRGRHAPNGTIELALAEAIKTACLDGSSFVTMGIVPLSSHGFGAQTSNPRWLKWLMAWVRAHGRRFYNFDGLDAFKSKFKPDEWEPIYAISREPQFSMKTLYAIAAAFSEGPPLLAGLRGIGRAAVQEVKWALPSSGSRLQSGRT
jgi:phosphatidylglycerol lysyltransferase